MGKVSYSERLGQTFGMLTIIEIGETYKNGSKQCLARCECGETVTSRVDSVVSGSRKSCGCHKRINGNPAKGSLFRAYKNSAKTRGHDFALTRDEFNTLVEQNCHYCGSEPSQIREYRGHKFTYNGIDRMDSSKGYEIDNVVSCCSTCNHGKMDMSYDEFVIYLDRLVKFRSENKKRV